MHLRRTLILKSILLALLAQGAVGQPAEPVRIDFRALAWKGIGGEIYFESGGEEQRLLVPNRSFTQVYRYEGIGPLSFYDKVKAPDGSTRKRTLGTAPVKSSGYYLFLVLKDGDEQRTLRIFPVPFDDTRYDANTMMVSNLTDREIAIMVGDERKLLAAQGRWTLSPQADGDGHVGIRVLSQIDDGWRTQLATTLSVDENSQSFLFIFKSDPEAAHLQFKQVALIPEKAPD